MVNAANFPLESLAAVLFSPLALDYLEGVPVRGEPSALFLLHFA